MSSMHIESAPPETPAITRSPDFRSSCYFMYLEAFSKVLIVRFSRFKYCFILITQAECISCLIFYIIISLTVLDLVVYRLVLTVFVLYLFLYLLKPLIKSIQILFQHMRLPKNETAYQHNRYQNDCKSDSASIFEFFFCHRLTTFQKPAYKYLKSSFASSFLLVSAIASRFAITEHSLLSMFTTSPLTPETSSILLSRTKTTALSVGRT